MSLLEFSDSDLLPFVKVGGVRKSIAIVRISILRVNIWLSALRHAFRIEDGVGVDD